MSRIGLILFCLFPLVHLAQSREYVTVKKNLVLMGSPFEITVVATSEELGYINIQEAKGEIERIEALISSWDPNSETSNINRNAGEKPVEVSLELFQLIERCKQITEITNGAFDITYAALDSIWRFDGSMAGLPDRAAIGKALKKVGSDKLILNKANRSVFLKEKGMRISFAAIGKGFAIDKAKELLVTKQVPAGVINAGGDISTWGVKATGEQWLLGVMDPKNKGKVLAWLPVLESSVSTSSNLDSFVNINGKRYTHVLDPRTGYPVDGVTSASVFSKTAELCDALATAIIVMGKNAGLQLIGQLGGTEAIVTDGENTMHKSSGIILSDRP